jgi:DUF1365 family protein
MGMTSCLYECVVMHHRKAPVQHRFVYRLFMFCLDLDEVDSLAGRLRLMSRNRWNLFSFRDADHLDRGYSTARENIVDLLRSKEILEVPGKIYLITHLRMLGHIFNPVSFYFCFDRAGKPLCAVAEVGNTFGEMKPFVTRAHTGGDDGFEMFEQKFFYVSPFIDLDVFMDFRLRIPGDKLDIRIDDVEKESRFLITTLSGRRKPLTDGRLFLYLLKFPVITVQVIVKIHYQALLLYFKRLPYHRKHTTIQLQREVYHAKH